jgi:hypothetical protein
VDGEEKAGVEGEVAFLNSRTADFALREPYCLQTVDALENSTVF